MLTKADPRCYELRASPQVKSISGKTAHPPLAEPSTWRSDNHRGSDTRPVHPTSGALTGVVDRPTPSPALSSYVRAATRGSSHEAYSNMATLHPSKRVKRGRGQGGAGPSAATPAAQETGPSLQAPTPHDNPPLLKRRTCVVLRAHDVDDGDDDVPAGGASLRDLTEIYGEDLAGDSSKPGIQNGLEWVFDRCPKLDTICLSPREDHEESWLDRDLHSLAWPTAGLYTRLPKELYLEGIATRYPGLKYLNVSGCADVKGASVTALAKSCRGLEALDVSGCCVGDAALKKLAECCPKLARLSANDCKSVTNDSLKALSEGCRRLAYLDVGRCARLTNAGITKIARGCPFLRVLLVSETGIADAGLKAVAEHSLQLEWLGVRLCKGVTDVGVKAIAAGCPQLKRLDVGYCDRVTDTSVTALAAGCLGLRHVVLARTAVTDAGVGALAAKCPRLEHLDVSGHGIMFSGFDGGVSDASIRLIAASCPDLRHLDVSQCPRVTDGGIGAVAKNCPGLESLTISCTGTTRASARAIATCRALMYLDASYCSFEDDDLAVIAKGCPKLRHLDVSTMHAVTKMSVRAISRHCTGPRVFKAGKSFCSGADLAKLFDERGDQLRELDLSKCCVSDATVALVADKCHGLKSLALRDTEVSDAGLGMLAQGCKQLGFLDVWGCYRVTAAGLAQFNRFRCEIRADQGVQGESDDEEWVFADEVMGE
eukprot:jgi/Mesvir1/7950/Mv11869-RA.1